jgi:hypothetical protein
VTGLRLVLALALAALVAGCGGGDEPRDVLAETASKLGEIRRGTLDVSLVVTPNRDEEEFGFQLRGPFSLGEAGSLPVMSIDYTQIADGRRGTVTLISTGRQAYAEIGGETYELPPDHAKELRSATGALAPGQGLERLPLDDWIVDSHVSDGGVVGGAQTDRVHGRLDVVAAARGLLQLARSLGSDLPALDQPSAQQLERAARSTSFELHTGKEDRLLRRLVMEVDFGLDVPPELRAELGDLVGAKVAFKLEVANPNGPVKVAEPRDVRPASELG